MMKILPMSLVLIVCVAGISEARSVYIGPKAGMMLMNLPDVDNIISIGGVIGYGAPAGLAAEIEFNFGVSGGDWTPLPGATGDFNIWTVAGYGIYRLTLGGGAYLKGKAGILQETVDAEATFPPFGTMSMSADDTGLSLGIGIGLTFAEKVMVETEATIIERDVTLISLGANFIF